MAKFAIATASATKVYSPGQSGTASASAFLPGSRERVTIANLGPNAVFWDHTSGVTAAAGNPIAASGVKVFENCTRPIWVIGVTADQVSPADTRVGVEEVVL